MSWRHRFRLDIAFERGSIILSGILSGSKSYGAETMTVARAVDDDSGNPRERVTEYDDDPSWSDEIAEFAAAIIDDAPITSGSSHEALCTMRLVYQIYCADAEWQNKWALSDVVSVE